MTPCKWCGKDGQIVVSCLSGRLYMAPAGCCEPVKAWVYESMLGPDNVDFWQPVDMASLDKFHDAIFVLQKRVMRQWKVLND